MFLAIVLVLFIPAVVDALMPVQPRPYTYLVRDAEHREVGPLGRAYEQTTKRIESKAAHAIFLVAVAAVAFLHLTVLALGRATLLHRTRQATWHDSMFFVAGLQLLLLGIALEVVRQGLNETSDMARLQDVLRSPMALFTHSGNRPYPVIDVVTALLFAATFLAPIGLAHRFAARLPLPRTPFYATLQPY